MKVSMLAKSAAIALVFGLVASTPAHAVDLQGSGASFPALIIEACKAPFESILENAGLNPEVIWNKIVTTGDGTSSGYDVRTETVLEDMVDVGIIDPVKVTRIALEKAASVAGTMLTTECVITDIPKDEPAQPQMPMM